MKHKAASLVVACAFLLAIVVSGIPQVNSVVTTIHANCNSASTLLTDGSYPIPPLPPPPSGQLDVASALAV